MRIVVSRSRRLSIVRVAMMPGIAHAKEERSGMKARPESPTPRMRRSMMKAARARYPESSMSEMNRNRNAI